jgi:hypothetical protein
MDEEKRRRNERKYGQWEELPDGGRRYWYAVGSGTGWSAKYVKEVDREESTCAFRQEIYDPSGRLTEVHEKFPVDRGHSRTFGGERS